MKPTQYVNNLSRSNSVELDNPQDTIKAMKMFYAQQFAQDGSSLDMRVFEALDRALVELAVAPVRIPAEFWGAKPILDMSQQWMAADILNSVRDIKVRPYAPLAIHAMVRARIWALKNADKELYEDPSHDTIAQRLTSFGFRGTPVGELVQFYPTLSEMVCGSAFHPDTWEFFRASHWVYCGVGCYTYHGRRFWCVNMGGADS